MAIKLAGEVKVGDVIKSQLGGDLRVASIETMGATILFLGVQYVGDAQRNDSYLACMPNIYLYVDSPVPTLFESDDQGETHDTATFTAEECEGAAR